MMKDTDGRTRGRPPTGVTPMMGLRVSDELRAAIVKWAEYQSDTPKLSEAIRRLVEMGLASASPRKPKVLSTSKQSAARAAELATRTIDKRIGSKMSPEERKVRKRKLVEGRSTHRSTKEEDLMDGKSYSSSGNYIADIRSNQTSIWPATNFMTFAERIFTGRAVNWLAVLALQLAIGAWINSQTNYFRRREPPLVAPSEWKVE